jgi:hypothetical protein
MHKLLAHLLTLGGAAAGYWTVFQTSDPTAAKGSIGAAALGLVAVYVHNYFATERNATTAAASLGQAPASTPNPAQVAAMAADAMRQLQRPPAPPVTQPPADRPSVA